MCSTDLGAIEREAPQRIMRLGTNAHERISDNIKENQYEGLLEAIIDFSQLGERHTSIVIFRG